MSNAGRTPDRSGPCSVKYFYALLAAIVTTPVTFRFRLEMRSDNFVLQCSNRSSRENTELPKDSDRVRDTEAEQLTRRTGDCLGRR